MKLILPLGLAACFLAAPLSGSGSACSQDVPAKPEPKVIRPQIEKGDYCRILGGPPESLVLRSGMVLLQPGKTVGKHNTEAYEELVIVLKGRGEMLLGDGRSLEMREGLVLYCPPDTEHNVRNSGAEPLRYIYVVAKTR